MILSFRVPAAIVAIVVALALVAAVAETGSATSPSIRAMLTAMASSAQAMPSRSCPRRPVSPAQRRIACKRRGDTDCSGETDTADVIAILMYVIENPALSVAGECVAIGAQLPSPTVIAETATPTPTPTPTATASPHPDSNAPQRCASPLPHQTHRDCLLLLHTNTHSDCLPLPRTPTPTATPDSGM